MKLSVFGMALVLVAGPAVAVADEMDDAYQSLKDAVAKKDAAAVKKVAPDAYKLAKQAENEAAPTNADEKEAWTQHVAYAKDVESFTEYSLYATAVQSPSETLIDLIQMLEQINPKSKYLADAYAPYFAALNATGAAAKIPGIAEKALEEPAGERRSPGGVGRRGFQPETDGSRPHPGQSPHGGGQQARPAGEYPGSRMGAPARRSAGARLLDGRRHLWGPPAVCPFR